MSEQQPKEYIITEAGMNTAIALLKAAGRYDDAIYVLGEIRPAPASAPEDHAAELVKAFTKGHITGAAKEREKVQPFIDLARVLATKCDEMQDLMRRNKIVIDNVQEPMQKLAFTFYSEIAELAHKAEVVIEEYEEPLREGAK